MAFIPVSFDPVMDVLKGSFYAFFFLQRRCDKESRACIMDAEEMPVLRWHAECASVLWIMEWKQLFSGIIFLNTPFFKHSRLFLANLSFVKYRFVSTQALKVQLV